VDSIYRGKAIFDGCALSRLHSQPLIFRWLRAVALAFAAAHFSMAARCRACIRSRSFFDGCALSRLHSQPLIARQGRKTVALEKSFAPAGASFCQNGQPRPSAVAIF